MTGRISFSALNSFVDFARLLVRSLSVDCFVSPKKFDELFAIWITYNGMK
jgi:hypothetical protein